MNRSEIVLAGRDLARLATLAIDLGVSFGSRTLVHSSDPVDALTRLPMSADVAVIYLSGQENVGDLLGLFKANPGVAFLLLAPSFPPHAAVARIAGQHDGVILPVAESPMVIIATLIALLSRRPTLAVQ